MKGVRSLTVTTSGENATYAIVVCSDNGTSYVVNALCEGLWDSIVL